MTSGGVLEFDAIGTRWQIETDQPLGRRASRSHPRRH